MKPIAAAVEWFGPRNLSWVHKSKHEGMYCAVGQTGKFLGKNRGPLFVGYGHPVKNAIGQLEKAKKKDMTDETFEIWLGKIISNAPAGMGKEEVHKLIRHAMVYALNTSLNEAIKNPPRRGVVIINQWTSGPGNDPETVWLEPPSPNWPDIVDCRDAAKLRLVWLKDGTVKKQRL